MRRFISLLIIGFLLLVNYNLMQGIFSSSKKLDEIDNVEEKISALEKENKNLKQELEKRSTSFYIEKEARDKLSYGKPGEVSIVVPEQFKKLSSNEKTKERKPNFQKWLELIFH